MKLKVIEGKELQKLVDNQEICLSCGLDRKEIRRDNLVCQVYGKLYDHHIYK